MKLVIFGLAVSSSWGNGHATLWRALIAALARRGHAAHFYERDQPYYAEHRDLDALPPPSRLALYHDWSAVRDAARRDLADADAVIVTSYCPDGRAACELALASRAGVKAFYDLDTPVTLARLDAGEPVDYLPAGGLADFDLALSYTGGAALDALCQRLRARRAEPLYGSVDPATHFPAPPRPEFRADLSYLGTYAADRQAALDALLLQPARQRPGQRFLIGGAQYPPGFPWSDNIFFARHVAPAEHPAFFGSSRLTLNVTRESMARSGYCPSGRLFEAAACGAAILSDDWAGLSEFFTPGEEILLASDAGGALAALDRSDAELRRIAGRARERALAEHTADDRARELERLLGKVS